MIIVFQFEILLKTLRQVCKVKIFKKRMITPAFYAELVNEIESLSSNLSFVLLGSIDVS